MSARSNRIAFVAPRFPEGPTVGGAETLLKSLAMRAAAAGCKVDFLTTCARNHFTWENDVPPGEKTVDGLTVHFFPVDDNRDLEVFIRVQNEISRGVRVSPEEEQAWLQNNVNSSALYTHLRENGEQYDRIVMGPYLFGVIYFAAQILPEKTLLVPCLHDEAFAYLDAFEGMFRAVRGWMFNTVPEKDLAMRLYSSLDGARASVVGMGMSPHESDGERFRRKHGLDAPYILYSGRREPLKGTPQLVDYLAAFRARTEIDVKLVLTGTGEVDLPPELAPHVTDLGFVSEQEKHDAMAGALVFCHPSTNESLGIVLLESWLACTPGLVNAGSEVLKHQCRVSNGGFWFQTYPEFEEELMLLLRNEALRESMGKAGREYVLREYSWEAIEQRMFEALDR